MHVKQKKLTKRNDSDAHVIGIAELCATTDISDAELVMPVYVMFRKDEIERSEGGVIL